MVRTAVSAVFLSAAVIGCVSRICLSVSASSNPAPYRAQPNAAAVGRAPGIPRFAKPYPVPRGRDMGNVRVAPSNYV